MMASIGEIAEMNKARNEAKIGSSIVSTPTKVGNDINLDPFGLGLETQAVGDTYRSFGASWTNAGGIAKEDWARQQQAENNALARDLYQQSIAHQQTRELRQTAYQDTIADMKKSGLNPILAYSNGATASTSSPAPSSRSSTSPRGEVSDDKALVNTLANIVMLFAGKTMDAKTMRNLKVLDQAFELNNKGGTETITNYNYKGRVTSTRQRSWR